MALASVVPPRIRIFMMNDAVNVPWLTIIGWGENGISALSPASIEALNQAGALRAELMVI